MIFIRCSIEQSAWCVRHAAREGKIAMSSHSITLTDKTFNQKVGPESGIVLVDFWASWCQPCLKVAPILDQIAADYAGKVTVAKLNVDDEEATARRFSIASIPTIAIFQDGRLVNRLVGVRPKQAYQAALDALLTPQATAASAAASAHKATHSVRVYSTPTCPWCSRVKAYLRDQHIAFTDIDVSRDARAAQDMMRRSGQMGVPQVDIDGQMVVGFDRKRIDQLLGLKTGIA